jgi:hypothetical protein
MSSLNGTKILILDILLSKLKEDRVFSTSLMTVSFLALGAFFGGSSFDFLSPLYPLLNYLSSIGLKKGYLSKVPL